MIFGGRQDLVLETKVANMEIKMGIMEEKGSNDGKKGKTMAKEGINKEANTDKAVTMEIKVVIMQGKEAKLTTKKAIIMIKEETSTA
eukprot:7131629-Ditylum_brightwellii.AAC.1